MCHGLKMTQENEIWLVQQNLSSPTASQVHQVANLEVLVEYKSRMNAGTTCMIRAKVVELGIAAKEVAFLLVYHQFLDQLVVFQDVQVITGWWFPSPVMMLDYTKQLQSI